VTEYDCQACGACCAALDPQAGDGHAPLSRDEARGLRALGLPVVKSPFGGRWLGTEPHDGAGGRPACVAFQGELGGTCRCSVYEARPSACRAFESGDRLCLEARELAGMPTWP
jgi:uncharacterized protein